MNCKNIKENNCTIIPEYANPHPEFCLLACPLRHGHKPEESFDVFLEKKHGIKKGEKKPLAKPKTNQQVKVVSCSDKQYSLLANYFRQLCMACDNNLHCEAKNFSKCFLKSHKWKTCPRDFWTEEMWDEAMKIIAENKEV